MNADPSVIPAALKPQACLLKELLDALLLGCFLLLVTMGDEVD